MTLPKGFDPPPPLPKKNTRCKMGLHSFENKVRGMAHKKRNSCICGYLKDGSTAEIVRKLAE